MRRQHRSALGLLLASVTLISLALPPSAAQAAPMIQQLVTLVGNDDSRGIFRSDLDGSNPTTVLPLVSGRKITSFDLSTDGNELVFAEVTSPTTVAIRRAYLNGDTLDTLATTNDLTTTVRWLPHPPYATEVLYTTGTSVPTLTVVDRVWRSTPVPGGAGLGSPAVHPGDYSILAADVIGNTGLVHLMADGSPTTAVASPPFADQPAYSPDGSRIAYVVWAADRASSTLWTAQADGSLPVQLDTAPGDKASRPVFTPDGQRVHFSDKGASYSSRLTSVAADGSPGRTTLATQGMAVSAAFGLKDTTAPPPINDVTVRVTFNGAHPRLDWVNPAVSDFSRVLVCRSQNGDGVSNPASCPLVVHNSPAEALLDSVTPNTVYTYTFFVQDRAGNVSPPTAHRMRALVMPTINGSSPTSRLATGLPFPVTLPAAPAGVRYYFEWTQLAKHTNTYWEAPRDWFELPSTPGTRVFGAGSGPATVAAGATYLVRAAGVVDEFGNITRAGPAAQFDVPSDQSVASYAGSWSTVTASNRWRGTVRRSSTAGASLTFALAGNRYTIVGDRCAACGQFRVYQGTTLLATVDTRASSTAVRQVLWTRRFGKLDRRTLRVVVVGTPGRRQVNIDAFGAGL